MSITNKCEAYPHGYQMHEPEKLEVHPSLPHQRTGTPPLKKKQNNIFPYKTGTLSIGNTSSFQPSEVFRGGGGEEVAKTPDRSWQLGEATKRWFVFFGGGWNTTQQLPSRERENISHQTGKGKSSSSNIPICWGDVTFLTGYMVIIS